MSSLIAFGLSLPDQQSQASRIHQLIRTNTELRKELAQSQAETKIAMEQAAAARVQWDITALNLKIEEAKSLRLETEIAALREEFEDNSPKRRRAL